MGTVPWVLVRRTASPAYADFGRLSSGAALVVVCLDVVTLQPYDCIRRRPDLLFCCFIEVTMTVVKSVSDGLRD